MAPGKWLPAYGTWMGGTVLYTLEPAPDILGFKKILTDRPEIEKARTTKNVTAIWIAVLSAIGIAFRHYRMYRYCFSHPENTDRAALSKRVNRGMEEFGEFIVSSLYQPAVGFYLEARLLLVCATYVCLGNSIEYEFGYRWYHQTQYDMTFKKEYLEFLGVSFIPATVQQFHDDCSKNNCHETLCLPPMTIAYPHTHHSRRAVMEVTDLLSQMSVAGSASDVRFKLHTAVDHAFARAMGTLSCGPFAVREFGKLLTLTSDYCSTTSAGCRHDPHHSRPPDDEMMTLFRAEQYMKKGLYSRGMAAWARAPDIKDFDWSEVTSRLKSVTSGKWFDHFDMVSPIDCESIAVANHAYRYIDRETLRTLLHKLNGEVFDITVLSE